jgi:hypothetical protein
MALLRVETREISGGMDEPRRIAVTLSDGTRNVVDHPVSASGIAAHEYAIAKTITRETFNRIESFYKVGETESGYKFTIFLKDTNS